MDGDRGRDGTGGARLGMDHLAVVALTLLVGGSVIALVGQHTAAQAGPAIVLSLLLAALGAGLVLCCLQDMVLRLPAAEGLHGLLAASWGPRVAGVLGVALLLELVATTAGVAQSMAHHVYAVLAAEGLQASDWLPEQVTAAMGLLMLGALALLPPRRAVLVACALLTVKVGAGVLLLALAARYVHYAHWIPWLPPATAPYRFGLGGVLAAAVPLLGVFASVGLALGFPALRRRGAMWQPAVLALVSLLAMLLLIVLAALQAGLVEFSALASTRPLSVALQMHPQLQWMLPLLPLAGAAGLAALQLVLLMLAVRLATSLWPGRGDAVGRSRAGLTVAVVGLPAVMLELWLPLGTLPTLPGPATLLVMAALCLAVLRRRKDTRQGATGRELMLPMLAPLAAALCLLAALERLWAWPG
ncbi:amino acid transporter [Stenotrophomonas maltophilia]|uniref:amino acid transporter n=1 Tax=Stenotrophomonas maltophilia TaxID=40324 RepID=UPI000C264D9B|nr:amino acid transporter [Stenotrophomonas maltophilia]MCU1067028.1 amino acid transporter [Stenotrophomonas maltophilia]MCU1076762.1 amino acid transporter [Stenotrophomonas maltophilia]MCU1138944.1 amino acid transporter [Stenotrophomonas maltophilia]PJL59966.1 amino acid transporter [Stenotrophomonas maltophilia]